MLCLSLVGFLYFAQLIHPLLLKLYAEEQKQDLQLQVLLLPRLLLQTFPLILLYTHQAAQSSLLYI